MTDAIDSILAIDHGSVSTKVALLDLVEGRYRFVTQVEALTQADDPRTSLLAAVEATQRKAGRRLLENDRLLTPECTNGSGVDAVVVTTSAGSPLRVLLAGIVPEASNAAIHRVVARVPAQVAGTLGIDDLRRHGGLKGASEFLNQLPIDVILFAGGSDGTSADSLVQVARAIAAVKTDGEEPALVYAGNKDALPDIADILSSRVTMHTVPNIEPGRGRYNLQPACEELYQAYIQRDGALGAVCRSMMPLERTTLLAEAKGTGISTRFIALWSQVDTLVADVGSHTSSVFSVISGEYSATVKPGIGIGVGAHAALQSIGIAKVLSWLSPAVSEDLVLDLVMNKSLRPNTVPSTADDVLIEMALTREILAMISPPARTFGMIVISGGVAARLQNQGLVALAVLDALQPRAPVRLAIDDLSLLGRLGALATIHPEAAGQVLVEDALCPLGTAISVAGRAKEGEVAVIAKVQYASGGHIEVHVPFGGIEVVPLARAGNARLVLQPARTLQIGNAPPGKSQTMEVTGGSVGVIIDARGRPLELPLSPDKRGEKLEEWLRALSPV